MEPPRQGARDDRPDPEPSPASRRAPTSSSTPEIPWTGIPGERRPSTGREREDKPVFLSIGYSTCHWCHVMAHESFEDETVAALLNEAFVCIKVDREERPDIDEIYMSVCQMMTGSGGWPLTIVMTPDRRPFFAATYIPKESRWGRMGLVELIPRLRGVWETRRDEVEKAAAETVALLKRPRTEQGDLPVEEILARAACGAQRAVRSTPTADSATPRNSRCPISSSSCSGTGGGPVRRMRSGWWRGPSPRCAGAGSTTSSASAFHRYSTDRQWLVPHFEKMLYDQALLALAYTEAFQATGDEAHARTVREILDYCLRDLQVAGGGILHRRGCRQRRGGGALLPLADGGDPPAPRSGGGPPGGSRLRPCRGGEFRRSGRAGAAGDEYPPPVRFPGGDRQGSRDDRRGPSCSAWRRSASGSWPPVTSGSVRSGTTRSSTDWNGLMIAALARAARVLDEPRYLEAARTAIEFIRSRAADGRRHGSSTASARGRRR